MKIDEAYEVIEEYQRYDDGCCTCHCGNPPCSKCVNQPSEEEYDEANLTIDQYEEESDPMHKIIIGMYPATKDAVLVQKWFGEKISNEPLIGMLLKGKEAELLGEARRLEDEEDEAKAKAP